MISLCLNINFDFCHWLLDPVLTPLQNPLFQTSRKPLSLQRSSFILDLYAPLSLDNAPVPDLLPNSWTTSDTSGILRVPRTHLKYLDKSMRWAQCMSWSQHLNPSQFWSSSAVQTTIVTGMLEYLVCWKGYGIEEDEWRPLEDVKGVRRLITDFHKKNLEAPQHIFTIDFSNLPFCLLTNFNDTLDTVVIIWTQAYVIWPVFV